MNLKIYLSTARAALCLGFAYCLFLSTGLNAEEKQAPHLFILSGQSNMTPTLAKSFRHCVEQELGKDRVLVSMTGHPGQPIKNWHKDWQPPAGMKDPKPENNGKLYDKLIAQAKRTLNGSIPATVTFVWMQGESDAGSGWAAVYEKNFMSLLQRIMTDLGIERINYVVGRINDFWLEKPDGKKMRELLVKLGQENPNGAWIDTDDLNRGVNPWGGYSFEDGHYPPAGYVVMGQRFAKEACLLINPNKQLNMAIFEERFFDSHEDIESHVAIGKKIADNGKELGVLLDGKFGGADHLEKTWIGFAPSEKPIELIIDLGEPTVIEEFGINMLLSSEAKAEFPNKITYSSSEDGKDFKINNARYNTIKFYNTRKLNAMRAEGIKPQSVLLLTGQGSVTARFLKIEIETGGQWVFIDEIVVNPK